MAERAKLISVDSSVEFDIILNESHSRSSVVTDKTLEDGSTVSDHVQNNPLITSVSGRITKDAATTLQILNRFNDENTLLQYIGRSSATQVVIQSFTDEYSRQNMTGYDFTMTLKQIKVTEKQQVEIVVPADNNLVYERKTAAETNQGVEVKKPTLLETVADVLTTLKTQRYQRQQEERTEYWKQRGY